MSDKSHWFGSKQGEGAARQLDRAQEREREREAYRQAMAAKAETQQQSRNNRLIVGGRAHTKKHGLS